MFWWLALAVCLYILFVLLLIAEVFVPSGGLLTVCALFCLIGGTYIFFKQSTIAGIAGIIFGIIMIPSLLRFAYKTFPKTKFGQSVTLAPPKRPQGDAVPDTPALGKLLGAVGVVRTPLRPVGICDFEGRKIECVAESGYIARDAKVEVIKIESTQLTVREIERI
ncbi:MAG: hypothetical protein JXM79_18625 [Sedimentisphaerales bacterium]|nr:hypothetical protein [Sedimentisphaerales bacterium]